MQRNMKINFWGYHFVFDATPTYAYTDTMSGSIDEPVEDGDTALHLTCLYGFLPCVQVCLIL